MRESALAAYRPEVIEEHVRPPQFANLLGRARGRRRRRARVLGVVTAVVMLVAAAGIVQRGGGGPEDRAVGSGYLDFDARAAAMIDAWQRGGLAYVTSLGFEPPPLPAPDGESLTLVPGGWPAGPDGRYERENATFSAPYQAYLDRRFRLDGALPSQPPPPGRIARADGSTIAVPLASAQAAYEAMDRADAAPGCVGDACVELVVTGATLGSVQYTVQGGDRAAVPAWLFTVEGLDRPIARVAVASSPAATAALRLPVELVPPAPDYRWSAGIFAISSVSTTRVQIAYAGGCEVARVPAIYETDRFVVVGVDIVSGSGPCFAMMVIGTTEVTLARPVGRRVVLSVSSGAPVGIG